MTNQVELRIIEPEQTLLLRQAILRSDRPLHESIFDGDDDAATQHWGAFVDNELIAIASLYPEPLPDAVRHEAVTENGGSGGQDATVGEHAWRLRGMAVQWAFQGQGYGKQLLSRCLQSVADHGGSLLWCNARTTAVGFYQSAGFQIMGSEFVIPTIGPHYIMLRRC